jgi:uncharacterized protein
MKNWFYLLILLFLFENNIYSQSNFSPWEADVKISEEENSHNYISKKTDNKIFNSPQGALYILLRGFQKFVSPQDGPNCGYNPTCSNYAKIAIFRYGAVMGAFLAGDRLLRCNPFNAPGDDPVPESLLNLKWKISNRKYQIENN